MTINGKPLSLRMAKLDSFVWLSDFFFDWIQVGWRKAVVVVSYQEIILMKKIYKETFSEVRYICFNKVLLNHCTVYVFHWFSNTAITPSSLSTRELKNSRTYSCVVNFIRRRIRFEILRCCVISLRGERFSRISESKSVAELEYEIKKDCYSKAHNLENY